jgi:hypothetical protein
VPAFDGCAVDAGAIETPRPTATSKKNAIVRLIELPP